MFSFGKLTQFFKKCIFTSVSERKIEICCQYHVEELGTDMGINMFDLLGFRWDRSDVPCFPVFSLDRVCFEFKRALPSFVWDAGVLENNPFTFPEVLTLMDGVTVGGRKLTDQEQILNLAESSKHLLKIVKSGQFVLNKTVFTSLHNIVARNEALEWGHFRGEGEEKNYTPAVSLGTSGRYSPIRTSPGARELNQVFEQGVRVLTELAPSEQALALFLFGALQQFFFDGNKRTSRFMMNGILLSHGMNALSVPAARALEFNEKMVDFYLTKDGTTMMQFLASCHPDFENLTPSTESMTGADVACDTASETLAPI